ncbi:MAG: DUF4845 domain-containing protein [Gammaproteobacteria bacterium HGW-Gammaproteobacteria-3]|nr:MAG: DUF4845 domain-containing protein [Gammaproteobacteria bacterium HGW-Gammaproteobacteria-3]
MSSKLNRQQGITLISLIFILGVIAFFTLLVLKIGPIYLDHSKVTNALAALEQTPDLETQDKNQIWSSLDKRFNLNYVYDVTKNDVKISKRGNYVKVEIEYEVVKKIAGNLSVLVEFHDMIEVGAE